MTIDINIYKNKLEEEKAQLENEMSGIGRQNPDNLSDWEATPAPKDQSQADENVAADAIEEYADHEAIISTLEMRHRDVLIALDKIDQGNYGACEICKKNIEIERLEANSAARTCRTHMEERR